MSGGVLIPQTVFVGDEAEFLYPVSKLENLDFEKFKLGQFSLNDIEQNDSMVVTGFQIKEKSNEIYISIKFIPWDTGEIAFPSFKKFGVFTELPKIKIASILEKTNTEKIQPLRPPLLMPGTTILIFGFGFTILFSLFLFFILGSAIRKRFTNIPVSVLKKRRIREFNRALSKLERGKGKLKNNNAWLKEYELSLRRYIESLVDNKKTADIFYALTYNELTNKLAGFFHDIDEPVVLCKKLFQTLQLSRYARTQEIDDNLFKKNKNEFLLLTQKFITESETAFNQLSVSQKTKTITKIIYTDSIGVKK